MLRDSAETKQNGRNPQPGGDLSDQGRIAQSADAPSLSAHCGSSRSNVCSVMVSAPARWTARQLASPIAAASWRAAAGRGDPVRGAGPPSPATRHLRNAGTGQRDHRHGPDLRPLLQPDAQGSVRPLWPDPAGQLSRRCVPVPRLPAEHRPAVFPLRTVRPCPGPLATIIMRLTDQQRDPSAIATQIDTPRFLFPGHMPGYPLNQTG